MSRKSCDKRNYCLILYPDSDSDNTTIEFIKSNYKYACCFHGSDQDPEGNLKKGHYHFVIRFANTRSLKSVSNDLNIEEHRIEYCHNLCGAVRYLVHFDDPDKFQYSLSDILSNFEISKYFEVEKSESEQALMIFDYIYSNDNIRLQNLVQFCLSNNLWSCFRRAYGVWCKLLEDKNFRDYSHYKNSKDLDSFLKHIKEHGGVIQ